MVRQHNDVNSTRLTRRQLGQRLAAAGFAAPAIASILADNAAAQEATPGASPAATPELAAGQEADQREIFDLDEELIQYTPTNYGTPLEALDGDFIVPNDLFYIRTHTVTPSIDAETWSLKVTGLVDNELELSLDDLKGMDDVQTRTMFLECSGDSRSFFEPNASGTPWGNTAIGNATWTGVPLSSILTQAGVQKDAVQVVSQGGDFPEMQRGLPIGEALNNQTMVVWEMNDEPLPVPHGGPVRLFVPGWGGIASTKWLIGLDVIDHAWQGHFNAESYLIIDKFDHALRPVQEMPVKAVIATPTDGAELTAGQQQTITGYAWSGWAGIQKVEVSTDGGFNWSEADIVKQDNPLAWVKFQANWDATETGEHVLYARATDNLNMSQPDHMGQWNSHGYQYNAVFRVPVTVKSGS